MIQTKTSSTAPKPAARSTRRPATRRTVKKTAPAASPTPKPAAAPESKAPAPAPKSTTMQTKKTPRIKSGQNWACEICGMGIVVDNCGCVEDHVFLCCGQEMNQKKSKKDKKSKKKKSKKKK